MACAVCSVSPADRGKTKQCRQPGRSELQDKFRDNIRHERSPGAWNSSPPEGLMVQSPRSKMGYGIGAKPTLT